MKSVSFRLLLNLAAVVSFAFALVAPTTAMADLITLKIPPILGDVTRKGFENEIEVMSLSFKAQVPITAGQRAGRAVLSDIIINKRFDRSSPALFLALVTRKNFPNALITFLQAGETVRKIFTITLTNIFVSKFATEPTEANVLTGQEQINLSYQRIQLKDEVTGEQACFDMRNQRSC